MLLTMCVYQILGRSLPSLPLTNEPHSRNEWIYVSTAIKAK
jgi:hypothetical protein